MALTLQRERLKSMILNANGTMFFGGARRRVPRSFGRFGSPLGAGVALAGVAHTDR